PPHDALAGGPPARRRLGHAHGLRRLRTRRRGERRAPGRAAARPCRALAGLPAGALRRDGRPPLLPLTPLHRWRASPYFPLPPRAPMADPVRIRPDQAQALALAVRERLFAEGAVVLPGVGTLRRRHQPTRVE